MNMTSAGSYNAVLSPDSPHPPCSPRRALSLDDGEQHGLRTLDVERDFVATKLQGSQPSDHNDHRPLPPDRPLNQKKSSEERRDVAQVQYAGLCLCVSVFWLGAVMVPVYTFWYFTYMREMSNGVLYSETEDRGVIDLSLFTRVVNGTPLARRGLSPLAEGSATAAVPHFNARGRTRPDQRDRPSTRRRTHPRTPFEEDYFVTDATFDPLTTKIPLRAVHVASRPGTKAVSTSTASTVRPTLTVNEQWHDLRRVVRGKATTGISVTLGSASIASQPESSKNSWSRKSSASFLISRDSSSAMAFPRTELTSLVGARRDDSSYISAIVTDLYKTDLSDSSAIATEADNTNLSDTSAIASGAEKNNVSGSSWISTYTDRNTFPKANAIASGADKNNPSDNSSVVNYRDKRIFSDTSAIFRDADRNNFSDTTAAAIDEDKNSFTYATTIVTELSSYTLADKREAELLSSKAVGSGVPGFHEKFADGSNTARPEDRGTDSRPTAHSSNSLPELPYIIFDRRRKKSLKRGRSSTKSPVEGHQYEVNAKHVTLPSLIIRKTPSAPATHKFRDYLTKIIHREDYGELA